MSQSYSLPKLLVLQIEGLVESGHFSSRSDVVKEALRFLLEKKPNLKQASGVALYKMGTVTLSKGAEITGVSTDKFLALLRDQGILTERDMEWETIE